jgi:hypothetical protein
MARPEGMEEYAGPLPSSLTGSQNGGANAFSAHHAFLIIKVLTRGERVDERILHVFLNESAIPIPLVPSVARAWQEVSHPPHFSSRRLLLQGPCFSTPSLNG